MTGEALSNSNNNINKLAWPPVGQSTYKLLLRMRVNSNKQSRWVAGPNWEIIIKYSLIIQRRLHNRFAPGITLPLKTTENYSNAKVRQTFIKLGISLQPRQDGEVWWEEFEKIFQLTGPCGDSGWSWRVKQPKPSQEFPVAFIPIKLSLNFSRCSPPALYSSSLPRMTELIRKLKEKNCGNTLQAGPAGLGLGKI